MTKRYQARVNKKTSTSYFTLFRWRSTILDVSVIDVGRELRTLLDTMTTWYLLYQKQNQMPRNFRFQTTFEPQTHQGIVYSTIAETQPVIAYLRLSNLICFVNISYIFLRALECAANTLRATSGMNCLNLAMSLIISMHNNLQTSVT